MEINANTIEVLKAWADISRERLEDSIEKYGAVESGSLLSSINARVVQDEVHLAYNYYGMFVDMGVGKGVSLGDVAFNSEFRGVDGASGRRPKKWYSPTMYREVAKLSEILQERFGLMAQASVLEGDALGNRIMLDI